MGVFFQNRLTTDIIIINKNSRIIKTNTKNTEI